MEQKKPGLTTSNQVKLTKGLQDEGYKLTKWTSQNVIVLTKGKTTVKLFPKK